MPRFFTLPQAEALLPDIDAAIRAAIACKAECERLESERQQESQRVAQRVAMLGGAQVDRARAMEHRTRGQEAARALEQAVEKVHSFGCLVKDLDIGLIDFPTLFRGEEVYLCWKLGERGIRFWHGVSEGFRGRKAIDAAFLENHRGELPN
jgi:hypothetical protein